jgi:hypothetical protein
MPIFEELFKKSKGKPIIYNEKEYCLIDKIEINNNDNYIITFERINSNWKQGIKLYPNKTIKINGQEYSKPIVLWENTAPNNVEIIVTTKRTNKKHYLEVHNIWDIGNNVLQSWHNGAAMHIEEMGNGKRYYCNDGHPDDKCDDLVFTIKKLKMA